MNCLLCWGPDTLVVTFRGTQSLANVKADAQVRRSNTGCCGAALAVQRSRPQCMILLSCQQPRKWIPVSTTNPAHPLPHATPPPSPTPGVAVPATAGAW